MESKKNPRRRHILGGMVEVRRQELDYPDPTPMDPGVVDAAYPEKYLEAMRKKMRGLLRKLGRPISGRYSEDPEVRRKWYVEQKRLFDEAYKLNG